MTEPLLIKKKICLLGSFNVGKTSLVRRFVYNVFDDFYLSTLGVKVSQKNLPVMEKPDGSLVQYQLMIWDIEGQDKFADYLQNYLIGSAGAVLVADLTRPDSWPVIPELMKRLQDINPKAAFVLAANKLDLLSDDHTHLKEISDFAKEINVSHWFTSAKTGQNVERFFIDLAMRL